MPILGSIDIIKNVGYVGKIELKEQAQNLRKQGYSYNQILKSVPVSKDTLSRWCRDIELTLEQREALLSNKLFGQRKGSQIAAENKKKLRINRTNDIYDSAKKELGTLNTRDNFVFGLALYSGEGGKTDGKGAFTNSDPQLIDFMCRWFTKYCNLSPKSLKAAIWIHEGNNEPVAKIYWSELTGIPLANFHKSYIVKRKKKPAYRKNIHEYGVISIRFYNSDLQRKILGWILAFFDDRIKTVRKN